MADGLGPRVGARLVSALQQVVDQLAAQPQFDLGEFARMHELLGKRPLGVIQGEQGVLVGRCPGVLDGQYTEDVAARPGQGDQPVLDSDRARLTRDLTQHLFLGGRGPHRIGDRPVGTGP